MAEKTKKQKKDFPGRWIVVNLVKAVVIVLAIVVVSMIFLNVVTQHNKEIVVPDFSNMSVQEASLAASQAEMRVEVTDSVYVKRMKKGAVYRQNPAAGSKVKKGRRVTLTINAVNAKKVTMPNLVGCSMRHAKRELNVRGLKLGTLIYVQDMATNNVLRQLYGPWEIKPGTQIESESVIDLVVGLNPDDNMTYIPDVKGLKYMKAVDEVQDKSLNVKRLRFDKNVKDYDDSLNAVVYKQMPDTTSLPVLMGTDITLYLGLEENSK